MKNGIYNMGGMSCASCSAAVERVTKMLPGVSESSVNLATNKLTISYDEALLSSEEIVKAITNIGFTAELDEKKKTIE
ncbi:MAG: hypothetical protein EOM23_10605 [Candidatus Moranbacteria bacterium]|nr:hypothetical protein [Candidatus Moranbacteria bacterium]